MVVMSEAPGSAEVGRRHCDAQCGHFARVTVTVFIQRQREYNCIRRLEVVNGLRMIYTAASVALAC